MIKNRLLANVLLTSFLSIAATAGFAEQTVMPKITQENIVFVSVHADDAPLAFGGFILNNHGFIGKDVTIYEPFNETNYLAGGTWAADLENSRVESATETRVGEDLHAFDQLFESWTNYSWNSKMYKEFSLRNYMAGQSIDDFTNTFKKANNNGYFSYFSKVDQVYFNKVYKDMKVLLNQKDCVLFSPIAPGNEKVMQHPDHFLVREAVVKAAHDLAVSHTKDICQIYFGEDQPYTNSSPETSAKAIAKFTKRLGIPDTDKYTYPIDAKAKWNVVGSSYHSQVDLDDTYKDGAVILNRTTESLYKWNPENYAKVHTDPSCKGLDFCKY